MATGFGSEGIVILHILQQAAPGTQVFYNTDLLFPETCQLRDQLEERVGIQFTRIATTLSVQQQNEQAADVLYRPWNGIGRVSRPGVEITGLKPPAQFVKVTSAGSVRRLLSSSLSR